MVAFGIEVEIKAAHRFRLSAAVARRQQRRHGRASPGALSTLGSRLARHFGIGEVVATGIQAKKRERVARKLPASWPVHRISVPAPHAFRASAWRVRGQLNAEKV
jgi:hypothetical protein